MVVFLDVPTFFFASSVRVQSVKVVFLLGVTYNGFQGTNSRFDLWGYNNRTSSKVYVKSASKVLP